MVEGTADGDRRRDPTEELQALALIDDLTGVGNQRFLEMELARRFGEMRRYPHWSFGVLAIDIDRLEEVNGRHGRAIGDSVLKMVAKTISSKLRSVDIVARRDGDEFVVIVLNVRERELQDLGERLRALVGRSSFTHEGAEIAVTVSVGAAAAARNDSPQSLVMRAAELVCQSKSAGRNRLTIAYPVTAA